MCIFVIVFFLCFLESFLYNILAVLFVGFLTLDPVFDDQTPTSLDSVWRQPAQGYECDWVVCANPLVFFVVTHICGGRGEGSKPVIPQTLAFDRSAIWMGFFLFS